MKNMKKTAAVILAMILAVSFSMTALADEKEPIVPVKMNEETMTEIAEDLITEIFLKMKYIELYSAAPDILSLGSEAVQALSGSCIKTYFMPVNSYELVQILAASEDDAVDADIEELLQCMGGHVANTMISSLSAQMGSQYIAFSSIGTVFRSYVAEPVQETVVVLEFDGIFSVAADFYSTGENVMSVSETVFPTDQIPELIESLSSVPDMTE